MQETGFTVTRVPVHHSALCVAVVLMVALSFMGCAAPVAEKKVFDIVWPLPPEEPKVKFVEVLSSNRDVEDAGGVGAVIFGEDVEEALFKPYGVAIDAEGRVFVTDMNRIFVFDKKNKKLTTFGHEAGPGKVKFPIGIAVTRSGMVYVTDVAYDRVFVYDTNGRYLNAIGRKGEFEAPSGVAVDEKSQKLYVADTKRHHIQVFNTKGDHVTTIGERGGAPGKFNLPTNLAVDDKGNLYVVDTGNFRVQVFNSDGNFVKTFGKLGDGLGDFSRPKGIALDSEGHIYVVDAAFENFQIFDNEGRLLLYVGEGGIQPGQFSVPAGIAVDNDDRIYVVDQLNARVQVFQYLGEKWNARQAAAPPAPSVPQPPKPAEKKQ